VTAAAHHSDRNKSLMLERRVGPLNDLVLKNGYPIRTNARTVPRAFSREVMRQANQSLSVDCLLFRIFPAIRLLPSWPEASEGLDDDEKIDIVTNSVGGPSR
jgi:hypothetical protein